MQKVELSQLPRELRRAVEGEITHFKGVKLLGCTKYESMPYMDKSIILTSYNAYTEWGNLLTVYSISFGGSVLDGEVRRVSMLVEDVKFFLENSDLFKR